MYAGVVNGCTSQPSLISAQTFNIIGPTAAR